MDDSRNFLSLTGFQNKYNLKVRPLAFYGLISAVKLLKGHINYPKIQGFCLSMKVSYLNLWSIQNQAGLYIRN